MHDLFPEEHNLFNQVAPEDRLELFQLKGIELTLFVEPAPPREVRFPEESNLFNQVAPENKLEEPVLFTQRYLIEGEWW